MISKEDKAKIEDFKEVFRMTVNPTNDEDINKVVDDLFKNVEYNYEEYKDEVPYVSVEQEKYKYHILQPVEGKYSLLDFLLNRAITNVEDIWITDENAYNPTEKMLYIDKKRYEVERIKQIDQIIEKQYRKSRLHETGHAIHALDICKDEDIHSNERLIDFKKKIKLYNELLGYKYSNILKMDDIKNKTQRLNSSWRGTKRAFVLRSLDEASTEYFATKYSGLFGYKGYYDISYIGEIDEKKEGVNVPNYLNGYSTGSCLMLHLENLVSKQAMFRSNFLSDHSALNEFIFKYGEIIKDILNENSKELPDIINKEGYKYGEKFLLVFDSACTENPNVKPKEMQRKIVLCYEILNKIFAHSYLQEFNAGRISKEKMLKIIQMSIDISPVIIDKDNKKIDTSIRKGYKEFEKRLKEIDRENSSSIITPSNISNATSQTVQANPGEMAKRIQSVSKSFAESLKQNTHSNDDGEPSTRSGYRYAQIDTYNRKKGQGR